jgi:hypothetical protein
MANEKRLRLLALTTGGNQVKLGAALSASSMGSSDTITFNGPLEYASGTSVSVGGDQYLPVVVDPDTANAEEIWVLATPNSSYQAACVRGVGSSTAAPAHAVNAIVVSGPMPSDLWHASLIDAPWGGNLGYDYEFQGDGTTLPPGWSWANQPTGGTYTEAWGKGSLWVPVNSGWSVITTPLPTQATWSAYFSQTLLATSDNYTLGGPMLGMSNGTYLSVNVRNDGSEMLSTISPLTATFGNTNIVVLDVHQRNGARAIWQVRQNSTTSYDFLTSWDGINWLALETAYNPPSPFTTIGFGIACDTGIGAALTVDWFRVR